MVWVSCDSSQDSRTCDVSPMLCSSRDGQTSREGALGREAQPLQQVGEGEARLRGDRPDRGRGRAGRGRGPRWLSLMLVLNLICCISASAAAAPCSSHTACTNVVDLAVLWNCSGRRHSKHRSVKHSDSHHIQSILLCCTTTLHP